MNHDAIASAICGRYVQLSDRSGYLESIYSARGDGTMLGAYIVEHGKDRLLVTDDGDTLFNALSCGTEISHSRSKAYRKLVETNGALLTTDGRIEIETQQAKLTPALSAFFRAALAVSDLAHKQRPSDSERFIRTVGEDLSRFGHRLARRPTITGLSGHQLAFHFGLDVASDEATMIHTVAAKDGGLKWGDVYEAGGKFKDAKAARGHLRLVAVLEDAKDVEKASSFFADLADVLVFKGQPLQLERAAA